MILEDSLADELKGLLIALYCVCENNRFNCGLPDYDIIRRLNISKATYYRHKKILIEKGYITPFDDVDYYDYFNYCKGFELTCKWIGNNDETDTMAFQEHVYTRPSILPIL